MYVVGIFGNPNEYPQLHKHMLWVFIRITLASNSNEYPQWLQHTFSWRIRRKLSLNYHQTPTQWTCCQNEVTVGGASFWLFGHDHYKSDHKAPRDIQATLWFDWNVESDLKSHSSSTRCGEVWRQHFHENAFKRVVHKMGFSINLYIFNKSIVEKNNNSMKYKLNITGSRWNPWRQSYMGGNSLSVCIP